MRLVQSVWTEEEKCVLCVRGQGDAHKIRVRNAAHAIARRCLEKLNNLEGKTGKVAKNARASYTAVGGRARKHFLS